MVIDIPTETTESILDVRTPAADFNDTYFRIAVIWLTKTI